MRTRRAYFDCRFGQLHVRTAFPATGGFDEQVTLFCLHADQSSSRVFRSIPARNCRRALGLRAGSAGIRRIRSLARPRALPRRRMPFPILRTICGCARSTCWAFTAAPARRWTLRRRDRLSCGAWYWRESLPPSGFRRSSNRLSSCARGSKPPRISPSSKPRCRTAIFVDIDDYANDLFAAAPKTLAKQIGTFLSGSP